MTELLKFVATDQHYPDIAAPALRTQDFREIYGHFAPEEAAVQASRCSQCGIPFCQVHCPLQNNIPDWLKLTAEGRLQEAYEISSATNTFPEICGRICPQDRLCEGNCVIEKDFGAVTIGTVEKFITENAFAEGWVQPIRVARENGLSVGIIGAGPAGLAAADMLRRQGYGVHVYDRYDRVGGLMVYGIPSFKLEKDIVARRHRLLAEGGIRFHLNCNIGTSITLAELRRQHDAVLIATGVYKARELDIPGHIPALAYLTASNRHGLGDTVSAFNDGSLNAQNKAVIVIGGGDTAMDCVRTAVRQGATSVTCLYRRDRANMPGSAREVKHAEDEGVRFSWLSVPVAISEEDGVYNIAVRRMRLGGKDSSGRQVVEACAGDHFTLQADMVITALGFDAEDMPALFDTPELAVSPAGTLAIDHRFMTGARNVFAAGDIVRGASLVVWAIRDGRDAAAAMDEYMRARAGIAA